MWCPKKENFGRSGTPTPWQKNHGVGCLSVMTRHVCFVLCASDIRNVWEFNLKKTRGFLKGQREWNWVLPSIMFCFILLSCRHHHGTWKVTNSQWCYHNRKGKNWSRKSGRNARPDHETTVSNWTCSHKIADCHVLVKLSLKACTFEFLPVLGSPKKTLHFLSSKTLKDSLVCAVHLICQLKCTTPVKWGPNFYRYFSTALYECFIVPSCRHSVTKSKENKMSLSKKTLKDGWFVAFLLDETTDSSNVSQLVVHMRVVNYGELRTFFIRCRWQTAQAIQDVVVNFLKGTRPTDCSFLRLFRLEKHVPTTQTHIGSDGGSQFSGSKNGFNVVWRRQNPYSETQWCLCHREALCMKDVSF